MHALLVLWPLYCASKARGITTTQKGWMRNALWCIGVQAHIPKAMTLVRLPVLLWLSKLALISSIGNNAEGRCRVSRHFGRIATGRCWPFEETAACPFCFLRRDIILNCHMSVGSHYKVLSIAQRPDECGARD